MLEETVEGGGEVGVHGKKGAVDKLTKGVGYLTVEGAYSLLRDTTQLTLSAKLTSSL